MLRFLGFAVIWVICLAAAVFFFCSFLFGGNIYLPLILLALALAAVSYVFFTQAERLEALEGRIAALEKGKEKEDKAP